MNVGSLFSGIGGFDLGLERAGMHTSWFCEQDEFCQRVLAKHWPGVSCYDDVQRVHAWKHPGCPSCLPSVDVLAGGFPCPVVSQAARGRNIAPWLWPEFARLIRELGPRYVVVENVQGLLRERFGEILGDLAESGFDATWRVFRASDAGAPHHRARVWLVGYAHRDGEPNLSLDAEASGLPQLHPDVRHWTDPPTGLGVAHGIPDRLDRTKALGNSLVPAIAEHIGRCVMAHAERQNPVRF